MGLHAFRRMLMVGVIAAAAFTGPANAQQDEAETLRSQRLAGEQADGFLGVPPGVALPADARARIDQINIRRRAYYTDLSAKRGASVSEVGGATACMLFRTKVDAGDWYRDEGGAWRQRAAGEEVKLPSFCG